MDDKSDIKKLFELGVKNFKDKNFLNASQNFEKVLEHIPEDETILENLALSYFYSNNFKKVHENIKKIISLKKLNKKNLNLIIQFYRDLNKYEDYEKIIDTSNLINSFRKLENYFFIPNFYNSSDEIEKYRKKLEKKLDLVLENSEKIELDVDSEKIDNPIFRLSYHNHNNLNINKKIVKTYRKIYPKLNQKVFSGNENSKIKIGFISEYFTNHTIMKLFFGIMINLDFNKFEIIVFHSYKTLKSDLHSKILEAEISKNLKNIYLSSKFNENIDIIKNCNLDIIFYPDIHMSSDLYFLTYVKLAKYHLTSWGHPETTGNNNINFFLSSKLLEIDNAQTHYSEKLILSNYLPMYFYRPEISADLEDANLKSRKIYSCLQTLIKIHPDFDEIIKKILIKDKTGEILFIKDSKDILAKSLLDRLSKKGIKDLDRIKFLDRLTTEEFIQQCGKASVLLDPLYFGSGNSFHESMYYGTPTVSLPTNFLKSRIVMGAYKQMKIDDAPIVNNIDDYVEKSVELANLEENKAIDFKKYLSSQAQKNLFENKKFIEDLENIFSKITENTYF